MTSRRVSRRAVSQSRKSIEGWAQTQALPVKVVGVVLGDPDRLALPLPQPHEEGLLLDVVALARAQQQVRAGRVEGHAQTAARQGDLASGVGSRDWRRIVDALSLSLVEVQDAQLARPLVWLRRDHHGQVTTVRAQREAARAL